MVMQKRLDYGFNGYQVPRTPRAARSARRRCLFKRKTNDNQMCAFDLLATVAGKLLLDRKSCPSENTSTGKDQPPAWGDSIAKEAKDEKKPLDKMPCGQICYERKFLITELVSKAPNPNVSSDEHVCTQNDAISIPASVITTSDCSEKVGSGEQLVNDDCKLSLSIFPTVDADLSGFKPSSTCGLEDETGKQIKVDYGNTRNFEVGNKASLYSSWNVEAWDKKPDALVSSVGLKFPFRMDHTPCGSFPASRDNVKLGKIDNDENSECTEACTRNKAFKPLQQVGDHRIRKFIDSKNFKATQIVKDGKQFNADVERSNYLNKNNFKRQRSPRDYPFKKRKLYGCSSVSNSDEGVGSDGSYREPENGTGESTHGLCPALPGVTSAPTSAAGGHASLHTQNDQVKLKIKSFRVPELFIEIPETATVGSLKRAVMDAVTSLLGGGLRVGVLLQGKRIRDDNKTLLQTGISHEDKMDSLGFMLEPSSTATAIRSNCSDKMLCESPQPLARYPPTPSIPENACQLRNLYSRPELTQSSLDNFIENNHDSAPSPPGTSSSQKTASESKALVPVPPTKQDSLVVVPLRKSKSECAQRRIRRPFTVAEVEALVQAVEKLGTGRWRDVKLRAFDNAKHRTYVDLKDKWKTLVHTARISPQQRRGEPVPQELLDRVLTAHAYWSQQQAKQQLKSHPDTCLLL